MAISLANLRIEAQRRSDMENNLFISNAEWTTYLNGSLGELYDLLLEAHPEYFGISVSKVVASPNNYFLLPDDFYKLLGLDVQVDSMGKWATVSPYMFQERNFINVRRFPFYRFAQVKYRLMAGKCMMQPDDMAAGTYQMWYAPRYTPFVSDSDVIEGLLEDYRDYIIIDAAIKALTKEESDASQLTQQKMIIKKRLEDAAAERDYGKTERISDAQQNSYQSAPYGWW